MYVHVLAFYIICSLIYFHIKIFVRVKQKVLTCIVREYKPFWQLSRLDDFNINKIPNGYSEPSRTSKIELFAKKVDD